MGKREADIVLKDDNSQIEITNLIPKEAYRSKNNAHGEGSHINARICEGFLRTTKNIIPYYFLIFNKKWEDYQWVNETCEMVKPKVITISTNFEENWADEIAKKIKNTLTFLKKDDN